MTALTSILVYLLIGTILAHRHWPAIAEEAMGNDRILVVARWVFTWPALALRS